MVSFYDVSLVDGYNLPMSVTSDGCAKADCPVDLGPNCPAPLKGPLDASGNAVGCKSACFANLDGNQADSANCCSGALIFLPFARYHKSDVLSRLAQPALYLPGIWRAIL